MHAAGASEPLQDVVAESDRILEATGGAGVVVRLLGGVAVAKHLHRPLARELSRTYGDIDLIVHGDGARRLRDVLEALGYQANRHFNNLHGERRLQYLDMANDRHLDVLIDVFEMCHKLDNLVLTTHPQTLSPADLLLTKLQVVQITEKDLIDACTLLIQHQVEAVEGDCIDLRILADVCRRDWGWFTTVTENLLKVDDFARDRLQESEGQANVLAKTGAIIDAVQKAPKALRWKARARVGRRVPWYILPEEPNTV